MNFLWTEYPRRACQLALTLLLATAALGPRPGLAEDDVAPPGRPMLDAFLRREVASIAERCRDGLERIAGGEAWEARRKQLREELREMLGLLPEPPRGDLRAVVTGIVERADLGIAVEKLHFQSLPGLYVTANLYRPLRVEGTLPAVLYLCGHGPVKIDGVSYGNKAHYQHHPAWLARNGYVCLIVDTLQFGEIEGKHHGTYRLDMWWWVSRGYTPAGVEAWSSMRAIDYLETRREVDPKRIGVTGRSGGGTGSWWLAALDDRPAAFVPVAGITDLENHVVDGCIEGHCDCNYAPNLYRWDTPAIAALAAPRPVLIANTDKDTIFPLGGVLRVHAQLKRLYRELGAPDRLGLCVAEGPHQDVSELQAAAFRWLDRWLRADGARAIALPAEKLFDPRELKVFTELPGDECVTSIEETFVAGAPQPEVPGSAADFERFRAGALARLIEKTFRNSPDPGPAAVEPAFRAQRDGLRLRAFTLPTEGSFRLPLHLLEAPAEAKTAQVTLTMAGEADWTEWVSVLSAGFGPELGLRPEPGDRGKLDLLRARLAGGGTALAVLAPRGVGPSRWSRGPKDENQIRRRFLVLGRTVEEARVHDARVAARALRTLPGLEEAGIRLAGRGDMALVAAYAALLEPAVRGVELWSPPGSHRSAFPLINVLRTLDVPQALALIFPREVVLHDVPASGFAWTRSAAALFEKNAWSPLAVQEDHRPPQGWVRATAHIIPKHTTAEGSGYFSIVEGGNGRVYVGTAKYRENAFLVELDPAVKGMRVAVDAMKEIEAAFPVALGAGKARLTGFAAQAKIHTRNNVGPSGRIYFATKQGYPREGEKRSDYSGGYPMVYDPAAGTTRVYDIPVPHHGIISITPDESRGVAYLSTCSDERPADSTHFMILDLATGKYRDLMDCRHRYAFIVVDHLGRAYHPILGGEIARHDPRTDRLERLAQTIDGQPLQPDSLLRHPEGHPLNWDITPDGRALHCVAMSGNQLYRYDLQGEGTALAGRSLGKLLPDASDTDCRAMCVGPTGEVWAAVTGKYGVAGSLLHLVSWRPGDAVPRDHGPIAIANPNYTELTDAGGKPLPWHHGLRKMPDGTTTPLYPMGICQARDGAVYVTVICPYTVLEIRW